jgi:hypothetical protein
MEDNGRSKGLRAWKPEGKGRPGFFFRGDSDLASVGFDDQSRDV